MNYGIHGLLRIKSNLKLPIPSYFEVEEVENPDVEILQQELDFKKPEGNKVMRIGYYYWFDESRLRFLHPAGARLELEDLAGRAKVRLNSRFKRFGSDTALEFLVDRILLIKLAQKGCAFVHAGAVEWNGNSALIVAPPDFGKTSTVLSLVGLGAKLLGDDHVILTPEGKVLCYPRPQTISPQTLTGNVVKPLGAHKRWLAKIRFLYAAYLRIFGSPAERREISSEFIAEGGKARFAFALGGFREKEQIETASKEKIAENIILPMPFMTGFPDSYADICFYLNGESLWLVLNRMMGTVRQALRGVECLSVSGPSIKSWSEIIRRKMNGQLAENI